MGQVKVSIIMGIFNCANTLDEAIDSILKQTFTDWNMIMCDDGSTDQTYEVAKKYIEAYPEKFILMKNDENKGLNYTLNRCLEYAEGIYIARMDGDDISLPTRLAQEVAFLDRHTDIAFVSTIMGMFDEKGDWGQTPVISFPEKKHFSNGQALFCHAACMIRKEAFMGVGGYTVDPKLLRVEDRHLWFKLYGAGYKGANINELLYKMRDDRNATGRRTWENRKNACYAQYVGYKLMHMPWYTYVHVLRYTILELVKGIMPASIYEFFHRMKFGVK